MKKLSILTVIASALMLASCDMVETQKASADRAMIFGSETGLTAFTNNFYSYLPGQLYSSDSHADWGAKNATGTYEAGAYTVNTSTSWSWTNIRQINYFLKYNTDEKVDAAVRENLNGVAYFFRAHQYFEKLKQYGAVPWIDEPLNPDDERLYAPRDTRETIVNHILADLDSAYEMISETAATANNVSVNKWTALALKARVALFEASFRKYHAGSQYLKDCTTSADALYQVAIDAAEKVMNSGVYALHTSGTENANGRGVYRDLFTSETTTGNKEVMLSYEITAPSKGEANWWLNSSTYGPHLCMSRTFSHTYLNADGSIYNEKNADGSYKNFVQETTGRDYRLNQVIRGADYTRLNMQGKWEATAANFTGHTLTGYQLTKWVYDDASYDDQSSGTYDTPLFRYAEILLIYAEAKAELNQMTDAIWAKTIGALRARAGITGGLNAVPTVKDPLLVKYYGDLSIPVLEVRRERAIELIMEGHRLLDLKRWKCGHLWDYTKGMPWDGIFVPALEQPLDINGDGTYDVYFTKDSKSVPAEYKGLITAYDDKLAQMIPVEGGYIMNYNFDSRIWNDNMYLYPVPAQCFVLNPNLDQNYGW